MLISDAAYMLWWRSTATQSNLKSNLQYIFCADTHTTMFKIVLHINEEQSSELQRDYVAIGGRKWTRDFHFNPHPDANLRLPQCGCYGYRFTVRKYCQVLSKPIQNN